MDLELNEEQKMLVKLCRDFAQQEITPRIRELDRKEEFPLEIFQKLGELGLMGIIAPPEYGGGGVDTVTYVMCLEELSKADTGISTTLQAHCLTTDMYAKFGTKEQKEKFLVPLATGKGIVAYALTEPGAGSDPSGMQTQAVRVDGHWLINGQKTFITSAGTPMSHHAMVMAATGVRPSGKKEISCFIVPNGTPGFNIGKKLEKIGWHTMDTREIFFEDCRVPEENLMGELGHGLRQALEGMNLGRTAFGAIGTGLAQACLDLALAYAKQRVQFGQPISKFQAIQFKLADMEVKVEAARQLTLKAAYLRDIGRPYEKEAAVAKLFGSRIAVEVADEAVQIHGGYGFTKEFIVSHHYCDAKVLEIGEGTNEIMRLVIARQLGC